jgi:hypothetical protein
MHLTNMLMGTIAVDLAFSLPYIMSTGLPSLGGRSETPASLLQANSTLNETSLVERESKHVPRNASLSCEGTGEETQQSDQVG